MRMRKEKEKENREGEERRGRRIENERRIHVKFRIPILSLLVYLSASFVLQLINQ
jgi:hypothetical protein